MKKVIIAVAAGLILPVGPVIADEGFSAGASIGTGRIEVDAPGSDFEGDDLGWKAFGAYQFGDHFGIEGGYIDFGEPDDTILGTNIEVELDGFDIFAVGTIHATENFDIFGKAGVIFWDAGISGAGVSDSDDGTDLALGFGGKYKVNDRFGIRGEWEWFDIDDSDTVWMLSIGGEFRFQ